MEGLRTNRADHASWSHDQGSLRERPVIELALAGLTGLVAGLAIGLIFSSKATAGATLLGGVLVAVGTFRTIQVTREGQITDRLTSAVGQLGTKDRHGHPDKVVVLGGIYALERIASQSDRDYGSVMEILTAYVRERARLSPASSDRCASDGPGKGEPPHDVQAALAVLGRRTPRRSELDLDLRSTDLRGAKLPNARLANAILCGTDLRGADLSGADLAGAHYDENTKWPDGFDFEAAVKGP